MSALKTATIDYKGIPIPTQQVEEEWAQFMGLLQFSLKPKRILEIGNLWGGGLASYLTLPSVELIVGVDITFNNLVVRDERWHLVEGDSHSEETLAKVVAISPKYDMLFLDGDHLATSIAADVQMYSPLVKKGVVVFHDIYNTIDTSISVYPVFDEFVKGKRFLTIRHFSEMPQECYGIGVVWQGDEYE